jgi:hypothetical protein
MNQRCKFTEDFKQEAAAQVIERGYPISKRSVNHTYTSEIFQGNNACNSSSLDMLGSRVNTSRKYA